MRLVKVCVCATLAVISRSTFLVSDARKRRLLLLDSAMRAVAADVTD